MTQDGDIQFDALADQYVERLRAGESPSIERYIDAHPQLESKIRELFPVLQMMENRQSGNASFDSELLDEEMHQLRELPPQRKLGEYRIIREIGRGGMGIVYQAEQESLGRHVALKLLPDSAQFDERRSIRFQHEARASGMLHHSNIVPVFGVGRSDDVSYFVMQFIDGTNLEQVIREVRQSAGLDNSKAAKPNDTAKAIETCLSNTALGLLGHPESELPEPNPEPNPDKSPASRNSGSFASISSSSSTHSSRNEYYRNVARIGRQISDALDYAHTKKILHRDIKPSNLLIDQEGHVWVTDFGLAKLLDEADLTRTGETVGTLRYLPPEQFNGQSDARSDVYSLGLTLYELLTLQPAFDGEDFAQLLKNVTASEPVPPRKKNAKIPRDLETIVMKAIAKQPESRYQSAGQLRDDLTLFLEGKPIQAKQASELDRLLKAVKRRPVVSSLVTLLMVSWIIGTSLIIWKWQQASKALVVAQEESDSRKAINQFLYDLLNNANPYVEPNQDIKLRTVLDLAANSMDNEFVDQPLINAELRMLIGQIYLNLGLFDDAKSQLGAAHRTRLKILGRNHIETQESILLLAIAEHDSGNYHNALELLEQVRQWKSKNLVSESGRLSRISMVYAETLTSLGRYDEAQLILEDFVDVAMQNDDRVDYVEGQLGLAWLFHDQGQLERSQKAYDQLMKVLDQMVQIDETGIEVFGYDMSHFYQYLEALRLSATLAYANGHYDEAVKNHRQAYQLTRDEHGPNHSATLNSAHNLAGTLIATLSIEEATTILADTVSRSEENLGADCPATLMYKNTYAMALLELGEIAPALELLKECHRSAAAQLGEQHPDVITHAYNIATAYFRNRQFEEAKMWQLNVIKHATQSLGADHHQTINARADLGTTYARLGRLAEAEIELRKAVSASKRTMREYHPNALINIATLLNVYIALKKFDQAEPLALELLKGYQHENAAKSKIIFAKKLLGQIYRMQDRHSDAHPLYDEIYQTQLQSGEDRTSEKMVQLLFTLTSLEHKTSQHELSIPRLQEFCRVAESRNLPNLTTLKAKSQLGRAFLEQGEFKRAEELLLEVFHALDSEDDSNVVSKTELRNTTNRLRELYRRQNNDEEFQRWDERYRTLKSNSAGTKK